jgi:hypothetical protein
LFGLLVDLGVWRVRKCLKHQIGFQIVEYLVVAEIGVLGQVQNGFVFVVLIIFVVEHFYEALPDEVHFLDVTFVADDSFARSVNPAVHANNQFIGKASFTFFKEVVE